MPTTTSSTELERWRRVWKITAPFILAALRTLS
jgi:hypothetical protein